MNPRAPSDQAKPSEFATMQNGPGFFLCSRPESNEHTVPLALLDPVFGEFVDDCRSIMLTSNDMVTARNLKTHMSEFYPRTEHRRYTFSMILENYGIPVHRRYIGDTEYRTDGYNEDFGHPSLISKVESEISSSPGGEPSLQALLYYHCFVREYALWKDVSTCHPCFIIFVAGESFLTRVIVI